ncbi:outer membrane protein transport protein [Rhodobacteraceae bacterium M385]|nr:outer membrane protein transport protein [Rhodobacteraceae bacterium M385]
MTRFTTTTTALAALLATTTIAHAGGIDRNGFNISPLFEEGDYAEFSYSYVRPEVSGNWPTNGASSGNMAEDFSAFGFAYRTDLTERLSLAFVYDDAFGADISYENSDPGGPGGGGYPLNNFNATLSGVSAAALLRYEIDDRISVYGGLRYVVMDAEINFIGGGWVLAPGPTPIAADQTLTYESDGAWGYTLGASYEIPDIAFRATVTYQSATEHEHTIMSSTAPSAVGPYATSTSYSLPQSLEVAVQSGVAEGTLVMASVRWTDWSEADIPTFSALGTISNDDVFSWMIGGARRLSDDFALVGRVTYEASSGDAASNLAPSDGRVGLSLAGVYDISDQITLTGGINYTFLGDATSEGLNSTFNDNSAFGVGFRLGYSF